MSQDTKTHPPKGLPGFLRRSVRLNEDENDDFPSISSSTSDSRKNAITDNNIGVVLNEGDDDDDEATTDGTITYHFNDKNHADSTNYSTMMTTTTTTMTTPIQTKQIKQHQNLLPPRESPMRFPGSSSAATPTPAPTPILTKKMRGNSIDIPALTMLEKSDQTLTHQKQNFNSTTGSSRDAEPKSSTTTTTTTNSNNNHTSSPSTQQQQRTISYKDRQLEATILADVVNMSDLRKLGWNGIPSEHRAQAWKLMLGYLPCNKSRRSTTLSRKRMEYKDAIAQHYNIDDNVRTLQEQEVLRQVLVDVPRTAPDVPLFRNDRIRKALSRLLYIWAMRHPASSYVQGINDLATPLMVVFLKDYFPDAESVSDGVIMELVSDTVMEEIEADCYWCMTNLLAGIQDHYTSDQPGVQRMVMRLEELVNRIDADLTNYLQSVGIQFMQFAFKWMNCLLLREFNLKCVQRLWDTYISEGDGGFEDFHVYVCAAFLCQFSSQLQAMEFDELFGFMQRIPTEEWGDTEIEILLSQAYVLSTLFGDSDAHLSASRSRLAANTTM